MSAIRIIIACLIGLICLGQFTFVSARPNFDTDTVSKSVVRIDCPASGKGGTGFVVSSNGHILTNNHVVDGSEICKVLFERRSDAIAARLISTDNQRDISIIKIEPAETLYPLGLATQTPPRGHTVWALGYPITADAKGRASVATITGGNFSSAKPGPMGGRKVRTALIQHSAAINPGNSGGPLLDNCGNVIGINTLRTKGEGVYFAVNITESIKMLRAKNISPQTTNARCENTAVNPGGNSELKRQLENAKTELTQAQTELTQAQNQLTTLSTEQREAKQREEATKRQVEELAQELADQRNSSQRDERRERQLEDKLTALSTKQREDKQRDELRERQLEDAQVKLVQQQNITNTLSTQLEAAKQRTVKTERRFVISMSVFGILLFGTFILALKKPRQIVIGAARDAAEEISRRISPVNSANSRNAGSVQMTLDYDLSGQSHQTRIKLKAKDREGFVIGRNATLNHQVISDPSISKRHFRFSYKTDSSLWIEDLNSTNGTTVKGQSLKPFQKKSIRIGTSFTAGGVRFGISSE